MLLARIVLLVPGLFHHLHRESIKFSFSIQNSAGPMVEPRILLLFAPPGDAHEDLHRLARAWGFTLRRISTLEALEKNLSQGGFDLLVLPSRKAAALFLEAAPPLAGPPPTLAEVERRHILRVLAATKGNKAQAARILDVDPKTLYNRLKRYREEGWAGGTGSRGGQGRTGEGGRNPWGPLNSP